LQPSPPWVHAYNSRQRSQSSADTQGWKHLPTPIRPTFRPRDYASPLTADTASSESNTNTFKVLHRSLHNLDFDPTCLDRLDEQLLLSPTESFFDVCYSEAIHDDTIPVPMLQPIQPRIRKGTRLYDRTAATDEYPFHDWDENYSVKFKKARRKPVSLLPLVMQLLLNVHAVAYTSAARTARSITSQNESPGVDARSSGVTYFIPQSQRICSLFSSLYATLQWGITKIVARCSFYRLHELEWQI
jgi:hypothetical protein